jgi:hypothetical protein
VAPFRLDGVAVNVTEVPERIGPDGEDAMETVGVIADPTDMVMLFDNAVVEFKQSPPLIVIKQVT